MRGGKGLGGRGGKGLGIYGARDRGEIHTQGSMLEGREGLKGK